ncbi:class I SAM-dependent methyltransferase [uncultured Aquimarina sp.]|uniref:class I SAM-dependent methyltransferase n=1 Tax=uncultured Aquimarina sp. TaxID=575652 RepID=UPI002604B03D|nr:class I SAM-dependent methyltransferase [uncultured Aquimarina sp.]
MDWRIKASIQKILSSSRIGDKLNHIPAILQKNYHENVVKYQFHECIRKFDYTQLDLNQKCTALEIGTGYSVISPVILYLLGFDKIVTVDIDQDIKFESFQKQIDYLNSKEYIQEISNKGVFSPETIKKKLDEILKCANLDELLSFCNIKYIAPYTPKDISAEESTFDYIYSQVVFEHIPPEFLEILFENFKIWLKKGCYTVHTINFVDHFTNPGFFQDQNISAYNFLKFSDTYWGFWAGNSIAYTNRLSHIYYQDLFESNNLYVTNFIGENYKPSKHLEITEIHNDVIRKYKSHPDLIELTKYQRGTFVVKNN